MDGGVNFGACGSEFVDSGAYLFVAYRACLSCEVRAEGADQLLEVAEVANFGSSGSQTRS